MKKALIMLLILLLTGCKAVKLSDDYEKNIKHVLNSNKNLANISGKGYKYYLPQGVRLEKQANYNKILYSDGNYYFLYIDAISYYYNTEINYEKNKEAYYSKFLDFDNKKGYLEINKINDKYLIEMMYNYAKVEAMVKKHEINKTLIDISYILSNIKFNDKILSTLIGEDILDFDEERFDIFKPTRKEGNFLKIIEEYDNIEEYEDDLPSFDEIELDEDYAY